MKEYSKLDLNLVVFLYSLYLTEKKKKNVLLEIMYAYLLCRACIFL